LLSEHGSEYKQLSASSPFSRVFANSVRGNADIMAGNNLQLALYSPSGSRAFQPPPLDGIDTGGNPPSPPVKYKVMAEEVGDHTCGPGQFPISYFDLSLADFGYKNSKAPILYPSSRARLTDGYATGKLQLGDMYNDGSGGAPSNHNLVLFGDVGGHTYGPGHFSSNGFVRSSRVPPSGSTASNTFAASTAASNKKGNPSASCYRLTVDTPVESTTAWQLMMDGPYACRGPDQLINNMTSPVMCVASGSPHVFRG
jgi:hypothetical protein